MERDNFDKIINKKLTNFEMQPPAEMWSRISSELNIQDMQEPPKQSAFPFKWKYAVAASVTFLLGFGLANFMPTENTQTPLSNNEKVSPKNNTVNTATPTPSAIENVVASPIVEKQIAVVSKKSLRTVAKKINVEKTQPVVMPETATTIQEATNTATINPTENIVPVNELQIENVPTYSAKIGEKEVVEDEIKVIESPKKEDGKLSKSEKKVLILERKINKKPEINYVLPLRF